jgi:hypothetical protein
VAGLGVITEEAVLDVGAGICIIRCGAFVDRQVFVTVLDMAEPEDGDEVEVL